MPVENQKKPKTKRSKEKYPALKPELNLKSRYELISDYDYLDQLSEEELQWLNKFTDEYVNAKLNSKNLKKNMHNTQALKKDCYDRNNSRNRDVLTRASACGQHTSIEDIKGHKLTKDNVEDDLIKKIDNEDD